MPGAVGDCTKTRHWEATTMENLRIPSDAAWSAGYSGLALDTSLAVVAWAPGGRVPGLSVLNPEACLEFVPGSPVLLLLPNRFWAALG